MCIEDQLQLAGVHLILPSGMLIKQCRTTQEDYGHDKFSHRSLTVEASLFKIKAIELKEQKVLFVILRRNK